MTTVYAIVKKVFGKEFVLGFVKKLSLTDGCYQNHESASLLLPIILIFGFHLGLYP